VNQWSSWIKIIKKCWSNRWCYRNREY